MGIDGFSLSNLGMTRNKTSAQLAADAEMTARQSLENEMPDVDGIGKKQNAGRKDPDAAFNGMIPFVPDGEQSEDEEQKEEQVVQAQSNEIDEEEENEDAAKYHFRLNSDNMIEVYDSETKQVVKTISPQEASNVMLNLSSSPGIFVNKKA